ncbi:hypothetical protein OEZ86_010577 [Tetradesmus obliquus]|nr:hypothetical protein OEZ86_010577 [Tetradesmus obliquus]
MASFLIVADDAEQGPAGFDSTINALLLLGSCNQAKLSFPHGAIEIEVTGSFASVQPQRRGRGSTRGGASTWWPARFQWLLQAHISTSRELDMLTRSPVLVLSCPCHASSGPCSSPTEAVQFMQEHSAHSAPWAEQLAQPQQLSQQLAQEMAQVQQHQQEALALPIQRTAALLCLEAAHHVLRTRLASNAQLRQLAREVLQHPVMWHVSSCYRPAPMRKPPALRSPHLMWLAVGAPPYNQSAPLLPASVRHYSLEACALVCCMRACNLLPQQPSELQVSAAVVQLLLQLCEGGSAAGANKAEQWRRELAELSDGRRPFVEALLQLRHLKLAHIVAAAADPSFNQQLNFCVLCGQAQSVVPRDPLLHCKSCCQSFHVSCSLDEGVAPKLYSMQAYPAARAGTCLGCQHFPLRATAAGGGLPWNLALEQEEEEAQQQQQQQPRAPRRSSSQVALAARAEAALAQPPPAFSAKDLAAAPVELPAATVAGSGMLRAASPVMPVMPYISLGHTGVGADIAAAAAASAAAMQQYRSASGPAGGSAGLGGHGSAMGADADADAHAAALGMAAAALVCSDAGITDSGGTPAAGGSSEPDDDEADGGAGSRSSSDDGVDDATPATDSSEQQQQQLLQTPWDAAAAVRLPPAGTAAGAPGFGMGRKAKAKMAAAAGAAAASSGPPAKSAKGSVRACVPLPGMAAPPAADVQQVRQQVLERVTARGMTLASLTCRTLLRHALLPEGLRIDFVGSKGRFSVVGCTPPGPHGAEQQLQCTVPGCARLFGTWQAAEVHARPNQSSRRHSTEEMRLTGSNVSVKELVRLVQSSKQPRQQQQQQHQPQVHTLPLSGPFATAAARPPPVQVAEQQHAAPLPSPDYQPQFPYYNFGVRFGSYGAQQQQPRSKRLPPSPAQPAEDDAAFALQLLSSAAAKRESPQQQRPGPAAGGDLGRLPFPGVGGRAAALAGSKRWLEVGEAVLPDNSSDVSVTSTAAAAERAGAAGKQHKRQRLEAGELLQLGRDYAPQQDQQQQPAGQAARQQDDKNALLQQVLQSLEKVKVQGGVVSPLVVALRVMAADERIQPHLVQAITSGDVRLLQQQLDFWSPETQRSGGAQPSKRHWEYDALEQRGVAQLVQAVCRLGSQEQGPQQAVVVQLCLDSVASAFCLPDPAAAAQQQQQQQRELRGKCQELVQAMLQLAQASLEDSSASHLNLSTAMLAAAGAAVVAAAGPAALQRLEQLRSICEHMRYLAGSVGEALWGALWGLARARAGRESASGSWEWQPAGLTALQQLLLLVRAAPAGWQAALCLPCSSAAQQQAGSGKSTSLMHVLFAALHRSFQLRQQVAVHKLQRQQQQQGQAQPQVEADESEELAEREQAEAVLLPAFEDALTAASEWLASSSGSEPPCAVHELLVRQSLMMQQALRALLLPDAQLRNVLAFVGCGLPESLADSASHHMTAARQLFAAAAGQAGDQARQQVLGCHASQGGAGQCQCEVHRAAFDCQLLGELLETTVSHVVRPWRQQDFEPRARPL